MFNTTFSRGEKQSKLTLAILLVLLVCQFLTSSISAAVQYPDEQHSIGKQVKHHHNHDYDHELTVQESLEVEEHDHAHQCHITCHPPIEESFASRFYQADISPELFVTFENTGHAPPIPPPSC